MKITISNEILDNFVMKNHEFLTIQQFYNDMSGRQEYRLYSYLTTFFDNTTILDIGTCNGTSAVALSHNPSNKVISYDIVKQQYMGSTHVIHSKHNIKFNIKNVFDDLNEELVSKCKIVMIDIDHYETVEREIINRLKELKFSGLIILDDITNHPDPEINRCMNRLWNNIEGNKINVTKYGHWSGTGIIIMNSDIELELL